MATPPFDLPTFLDHLHGDSALAAAMAALFLSECPGQLDGVRRAVAAGDAPSLERAAHLLKGSVGNFMAVDATEAAAWLEEQGRAGNLADASSALRALEAALDRLTTALREVTA